MVRDDVLIGPLPAPCAPTVLFVIMLSFGYSQSKVTITDRVEM